MNTERMQSPNGKHKQLPQTADRDDDRDARPQRDRGAPARDRGDDHEGESPAAPPKSGNLITRHPWRIALIAAAALVLAIGAGAYYLMEMRPYESTDDAYIDGHISAISPQVSARVAAVLVDDNQFVHKGQLLVELDPTNFQVALDQAQGAEASARGKLEQARAGVGTAQSAIPQARAAVKAAQATLDNAEANLKRYQSLTRGARSQQDVDKVVADQKTAAAALEQARAQLNSAESQLAAAKASLLAAQGDLQKAQADTENAKVNLGYCRITAPEDGRITNKSVELGNYVTPANPLFQIVPPEVWVTANFKETQLTLMRPGQRVSVKVDAYPTMKLQGTVDSIQDGTGSRFSIIPAENATGNFVKVVQRVPVKIVLAVDSNSNDGRLLAPGMSVDPNVRVR